MDFSYKSIIDGRGENLAKWRLILCITIWQNLYKTFSPGKPKLNFRAGYNGLDNGKEDPLAGKP
jgi:hypothetical protein